MGFLDEAGTRVADGTAFVNNVQPNQTTTWEATAFQEVAYARCEVSRSSAWPSERHGDDRAP